jgi:hypothetical protein
MQFKPSNYPNYSSDMWASSYIKEELIYQLSSASLVEIDKETNVIHITHKYYDLAEFVLYRINLWNPATPPVFTINTSDLTPSLYTELEQLKVSSPHQFDKVVTEAVQTLLEGINKRYYHIAGLLYKVTWRLEL